MTRSGKLVLFFAVAASLALTIAGIRLLAPATARAETPRTSSWPSELVLPAGQKLVGVSWLCHAACEPWTTTRPMRSGESAESYTFSNGTDAIRVRETPPSSR